MSEIRIRLEQVKPDYKSAAYFYGLSCLKQFEQELPADHSSCIYVGQVFEVWVQRMKKTGTLIARVRESNRE